MRVWLMVLLLPIVTGCTQRMIHVTSEPSGALVYLNDEQVGRTPVSVPFTFYGVYDVRLEREGFAPMWTEANAVAPAWEYPGPDLVAELIPGMRSDVRWHFDLQPQTPAAELDADALLQRAQGMRRETATPEP
jgi:hypothetical protein